MRRPNVTTTVVLGMLLAAALGAQGNRPMTINDLLVAVRVGDPQLSPDGKSVLYVRTTTEASTYRRNADIYLAAPDPRMIATRPFITGDKSENSPRWFPDGKSVTFISSRDGEPQVFVANAEGGNTRKITNISGGVQPPLVVSPDGSMVAFVADVYPDCPDDACNKARRAAADADPVKVHVLTRLLYRHWDEWRENIRHHVFVASTTVTSPGVGRDLTPGDFDSPPGQAEDAAIAFAPDSKSLAFVSNRDGNDKESWST